MTDSNNNNKFLPPSKNSSTKFGSFTITIQRLTFFSQNKQSCIIKLQFWGSAQATYIPLYSSQTFTIVTPLNLFKAYLIDSKAIQFQIVDSRNYKPIACAFLNWMPYLRALEDRQTYVDKQDSYLRDKSNIKTFYLPFYDEIIQENLPIYHFTAQNQIKKEAKVGELTVKWECRMYEPELQSHTASNINSGANLYNIRVSEISNRKNDPGPVSICNIEIQEEPNQDIRTNRSILSKQRQSNSPKLYTTDYPMPRKSNVSILDNYGGHLRKVREEPEIDQSKGNIDRGKGINELDLQLIRMRMQMEELVGPANKKIESCLLQIIHFQAISKGLPGKDLAYCDIRSEGKDKQSHWRIFPESQGQQKIYFNSTLSIKPGSLLSFIIGMKKGKDTYKGSMPLDCIRDNYDINIISSSGPVVGYLRVKIDRKTDISIQPQISLEKKQKRPQIIKKDIATLPQISSKLVSEPQKSSEAYYKSQKIKEAESYFLFAIQNLKKVKNNNLSYKVFDMMIGQINPQKIAFVSQGQFINKPLVFYVYQNNKQIYQQILINNLKSTPFAQVNLTCSLVFQKINPQLEINCQLYAGNLKQINYYLQKISQPQWKQHQQYAQPRFESNPVKTEQSNKNSLIAQYQMQVLQEQKRKMKTEAMGGEDRVRRLTEERVSGESVAMQKYQLQSQNQGNQDENIYLVDLLTRFLDFLPENLLPEVIQMPKEKFLQILLPKLKNSAFQIELVDIIISIFQEFKSQIICIAQLSQCLKAYKSFFNIYHQQKQTIIKQILEAEPKAVQRIRNNSEFGTLNDSMLWGRALSKVKDASVKQKINKFYKISAFGTADAALLLDDLSSKGKQLRSLDISNLGMMIKDWVQQFVSHAQLQKILSLKEMFLTSGEQDNYLNIRSVAEVVEMTLQLRLSLWQSLMLIEQIKGAYGCDLQLEEGVIGGPSLLSWIDGVRKRTNLRTENSQISDSQASLDPEELALIKQINQHNNRDSQVKRRESGHKSQSRSMVGVNNDSDIADIANLLREKDGLMQLEIMEQTKTRNVRENKSVASEEKIIKDSLKFQNENVEIISNKKPIIEEIKQALPQKLEKQKQTENVAKQKERVKQMKFYLQIKQFKLYNEKMHSQLIKALFLLQNANSQPSQDSFFYLTPKNNFSQANQSIIKYVIDKSVKFQHKGIKILLNDEQNKLLFNGFLPIQQISDWFSKNQAECKRTIVLYQSKGKIGGKLVINLLLNHENYQKNKENVGNNFTDKINVTINSITPHLKGVKLYARTNQTDRIQLRLNEEGQIQFKKPIYHCELILGDESESSTAIISLQQLYLKHYINESYPLIDSNVGNFVATVSVTLSYNQKGLKKTQVALRKDLQTYQYAYPVVRQEDPEQKRGLISQIDGIYESLKLRYG